MATPPRATHAAANYEIARKNKKRKEREKEKEKEK